MDITLARTFLTVSETGSFIDAARRMHVTQSTVSARIKSLEDALGMPLFERSRTGADLTSAGEQFRKHAIALVRVWQHARLEVQLTAEHSDHLAVGASSSFWNDFLIRWVSWMREEVPQIAVSASSGSSNVLVQRLLEGTLDLAIMYRPPHPPGLVAEHLFDDEIVLVTSVPAGSRRKASDYVFVDWGRDFRQDHATAYPELTATGLHLDIGISGLNYLLSNEATGYFPMRLVKRHLPRSRLRVLKRRRKFTYPVFAVYPEARDEDAYEPLLEGLRRTVSRLA
ncbi:MAG: LysR family transcriptional regulator [Pseudomonadota bacterium]